jgi:hypothetical protein
VPNYKLNQYMKKINLTRLVILCCLTLSCNPKTEKKQPTILYNTTQTYKFDDDEILRKNTKNVKKKIHTHQDKRKKVNLKK